MINLENNLKKDLTRDSGNVILSTENKEMTENKQTKVQEYLNTEIIVGGEKTTIGKFMKTCRDENIPQRCIDMYLFVIINKKN